MEEELSDFEKKVKTIWKEFVDDPDVRVEQVSKKAQENLNEGGFLDAALLFDAAAKKLEMRKMMLASTADLDALGEVIKAQLGLMVKAGDALIKLMDQSEDDLLNKTLDASAEKAFNEYSIVLQFTRKLLVDATELRKSTKYATKLKDSLNDADLLLMKSYFKPKFNTKQENVVNHKLCGRTLKEYLEANGDTALNGDDTHDLWLVLQQLQHPLYVEFLKQQIAHGQLRYPDNTLIVDPYGSACFKTIREAVAYVVKEAKFAYVRSLMGVEKVDARTQFSILVQPEIYENDLNLKNLPKNIDMDVIGNVGCRKYGEVTGVNHPSTVVVKQTEMKETVKEMTPMLGVLEDRKATLRFARLEMLNESTDPLRPSLLVQTGSSVEMIDCLVETVGAECVIVKGKNASVKMSGTALERSTKAYEVQGEAKLIMSECRVEDIRSEEGGCVCVDGGVCQISETKFLSTKNLYFGSGSRGIFNKCVFIGEWNKNVNTDQKGALYKGVCLEDESRVSIQNSSFENFEVAIFALRPNNHVALGYSRVADSCKVCAEICEDANATLRHNEINCELVMGIFANGRGKVLLEENTSSLEVEKRRQFVTASVLIDDESKPPTMIGQQYEIITMNVEKHKEDTNAMMRRMINEKKEEMAREKEAAAAVAAAETQSKSSGPSPETEELAIPSSKHATQKMEAAPATDLPAAAPEIELADSVPETELDITAPATELAAAVIETELAPASSETKLAAAAPVIKLVAAVPETDFAAAAPAIEMAAATLATELAATASETEPTAVAPEIGPAVVAQEIELAATASETEPTAVAPEIGPAVVAREIEPAATVSEIEPAAAAPEIGPAVLAPEIEPADTVSEIEPAAEAPVTELETAEPVTELAAAAPQSELAAAAPQTELAASPADVKTTENEVGAAKKKSKKKKKKAEKK